MKRYTVRLIVAALALALPATASAQKDNKYTKEAQKFIGLAMTRQDSAARAPLYQQALAQLEEGLAKEPQNAKVWLLAGQAHAALNHFVLADSAFRMAVQLHPPYAEDVGVEREQAWVSAFNLGAAAMNEGKYDEAIVALEQAQMMYQDRPEALMNLGVLYANQNQPEKAVAAFEGARAAVKGPLFEKLNEEQKAGWVRFEELARINIAQMAGQQGVDQFTAKQYDAAVASFRKAAELNPYSRDYTFNLAQSVWAQAGAIEEKLDSMPKAQQAEAKPKLIALYTELDKIAEQVLQVDPSSEMLFIIRARSHRMIGEYSGDPAKLKTGQDAAVRMLEAREALPVEISEIMVNSDEGTATVKGTIKNRKLADGANTAITFTLLGIDGRVIGEQELTVPAPAKEQTAAFEGKIPVTGEIAGWKYAIK